MYQPPTTCPQCSADAVVQDGNSIAYACGSYGRPDGDAYRQSWVCLEVRRLRALADSLREQVPA